MCGRFAQTKKVEEVEAFLEATADDDDRAAARPHYNAAPSQPLAVARVEGDGARRLRWLTWGFSPPWDHPGKQKVHRPINARAESAGEKAMFRAALARRRCLVPADGFFEWRREGKTKLPFFITLPDHDMLAIAGIWSTWRRADGPPVDTFAVLTVDSTGFLDQLHDRMPLIVAPDAFGAWLDPASPPEVVRELLASKPPAPFELQAVSTRVNNAQNDDPECLAPAEHPVAPEQPELF